MRARLLIAVTLTLLTACAGEVGPAAPGAGDAHPADAPRFAPAAAARAPCDAPTTLSVHRDPNGFVDRLFAKALLRDAATSSGAAGASAEHDLLVDTGSEQSFVLVEGRPEYTSATSATITCRETTLPNVPVSVAGNASDDRDGVLGADLVGTGAVLDLDLEATSIVLRPDASAADMAARAPGAVVIPVEWRSGWLVASGVVLDGRPVKLVVDTGSPHVFYMSATPRDGEVETHDDDGSGDAVTYYVGEGDVALPGTAARRVPVDRAASFPTLEAVMKMAGPDVSGLLGLSALGDRHIVIGKTKLVVTL